MKIKVLLLLLATAFVTEKVSAQRMTFTDPFVTGDKYIGAVLTTSGSFVPSSMYVDDTKTLGDYSKSLVNPGLGVQYRRVKKHTHLDCANTFYVGFNRWSGKAEGRFIANTDSTWSTKYHYTSLYLTAIWSLVFPIGNDFAIETGAGATLSPSLTPQSTTTLPGGVTVNDTGNGFFSFYFNLLVGATYRIDNSFTATLDLQANAFNLFGLFSGNEYNAGYGLSFSQVLPFHLMVGLLYAL